MLTCCCCQHEPDKVLLKMNCNLLITGGATRIGATIADTLLQAGYGIVIHACTSTSAAADWVTRARNAGHQAWWVGGDLLESDGPEKLFASALAAATSLHGIINNAATFARQPLLTATNTDFETAWRLNTLAPIRLTLALAKHLHQHGTTGTVVNLLDQRIAHPASTGAIPYLLSKQSLECFTRAAALELAPTLRINAVAPGAVLPPPTPAGREPAGSLPLMQRPTPLQVAEAILYLLQAATVTGQTIYVDSGQHLQP